MTATAQPGVLFVGVDGGGTGCRARIEDAEGSLLGTGIAGPAALRIGVDRALAEVEKACRVGLEEAGLGPNVLGS
ncbi:MAG: N-acetylglucosamine kinase, partial [Pseudolabrys sp.]